MSFLPIVQRELLAAARRRSTYRIRSWAAVFAIGAALVSLFFYSLGPGQGSAGKAVFSLLTTYAFGFSLLAGVILTSDCLSGEKREGTLGLLFLTELKGYDVVLGKFTALSLNAFYSVLALLPAAALPFVMGGLTGGEFWRTALAILTGLFFSLSAGVLVSTYARDSGAALGAGFALLLGFAAVGWLPRFLPPGSWLARLQYLSPVTPLFFSSENAYVLRSGSFWTAVALSCALGVGFLLVASLELPKIWQQTVTTGMRQKFQRLFATRTTTPASRSRLLDVNPVLWLTEDELALRWGAWGIVAVSGVIAVIPVLSDPSAAYIVHYPLRGCGFLLKCLIALQACRFFAEGRRTGALEMLLSTPLTQTEILRGQSLAFRRIFLAPLVVFVTLTLLPAVLAAMARLGTSISAALSVTLDFIFGLVMSGSVGLAMVADVFALIWFGRWLALSSKNPRMAAPMTILFVLVLPTFAFCGLYLLVDLVLVLYASGQLKQDFRWILAKAQSKGAG